MQQRSGVLIRDLVPPLLWRALRPQRQAPRFPSYAAALAECAPGYDSAALAGVVAKKTIRYRDRLAAAGPDLSDGANQRIAIALGLIRNRASLINVIDYGGAAGAHFFAARALWGDSVHLAWHVVETPSMARAATQLEGDGLRFFDSQEAATAAFGRSEAVDLAFSSGTLPYVPEPRAWLRRFVALGAPYLALVRCQLHEEPADATYIQTSLVSENGPGPLPVGETDAPFRNPLTICHRAAIEGLLRGPYDILIRTQEPAGFGVNSGVFGYYCRART